MKLFLSSLAVFVALVLNAAACIGDTPEQCKARYGEPVHTDPKTGQVLYAKAGLGMLVTFWKGKVHEMSCSRIDAGPDRPVPQLTKEECLQLAQLLSKDPKWKEVQPSSKSTTCARSNGNTSHCHEKYQRGRKGRAGNRKMAPK